MKTVLVQIAKIASMALIAALLFNLDSSTAANAQINFQTGVQSARGDGVPATLFGQVGIVSQIINILLFLIGVVSVIMIILGGFKYALSGGDSDKVTGAKNTVLYAIIGLIVAILAFAIINFVIGTVSSGSMGDGIGGGGSATSF